MDWQPGRAGSIANGLVRVLLAPSCALCDQVLSRPLESPVCSACWTTVRPRHPPWCPRCGDETFGASPLLLCNRCREGPRAFLVARSAGLYEGTLRQAIQVFKYRGRRQLAAPLAELMVRAGRDLLEDADAVVPVPLHPWRLVSRGFNQADDLAVCCGRPVWRVLRRTRRGAVQAGLRAGSRQQNARQLFVCRRRRLRKPPDLRQRVLVLIDDVMTTGATAEACAQALIDAGATTVRVLTAARAVARWQPQPRRPLLLSPAPRR